MNAEHLLRPVLILLLVIAPLSQRLVAGAEPHQAPIDQAAIAKRLLSDIPLERDAAFADAIAIDPENRGPVVRTALIALLAKLNKAVDEALRQGLTVDHVESPEFISAVSRAVADLRDAAAIPAMAGALGSFSLIQPLAEFGQQAAPAVLGIVTSSTSHYSAVNDGLRVLRLMVERQQSRPLSPGTLAQIRQAARQRLSGQQYFTTLWYTIDLAAVLADSDLRDTIENLANHSSEVVARGVTDPRLVAQTRQRARDRLAGVPANPRPK
jgi:hypothetical protein